MSFKKQVTQPKTVKLRPEDSCKSDNAKPAHSGATHHAAGHFCRGPTSKEHSVPRKTNEAEMTSPSSSGYLYDHGQVHLAQGT